MLMVSWEHTEMYKPPFTLTSQAVNLIAEIAARVERCKVRMEHAETLRLRKANRIRTIHSSLAIEGNRLSEGQVRDIINGRQVIAPPKEIQEVKNAIRTYELYPELDPFRIEDLLRAHRTMMEALTDQAGMYRSSGVGVFSGTVCLHMAPPAARVPQLVEDLFAWLVSAGDHLLVRSCVFHYEFEFIHPFTDGNGRMGRLWQSLILGKWTPLFADLPVENMVYANQQAYYDAIAQSTERGDCAPFIEFSLAEILRALEQHQGEISLSCAEGTGDIISSGYRGDWPADVGINVGLNVGIKEKVILRRIAADPRVSARQLAQDMKLSGRQCERLLAQLRDKGYIRRVGANKNGFWEILRPAP